MRRYLGAYAINTAGVIGQHTLMTAAGISRDTADEYESLLANLFVVEAVPAWWSNGLKRLAKSPNDSWSILRWRCRLPE